MLLNGHLSILSGLRKLHYHLKISFRPILPDGMGWYSRGDRTWVVGAITFESLEGICVRYLLGNKSNCEDFSVNNTMVKGSDPPPFARLTAVPNSGYQETGILTYNKNII